MGQAVALEQRVEERPVSAIGFGDHRAVVVGEVGVDELDRRVVGRRQSLLSTAVDRRVGDGNVAPGELHGERLHFGPVSPIDLGVVAPIGDRRPMFDEPESAGLEVEFVRRSAPVEHVDPDRPTHGRRRSS